MARAARPARPRGRHGGNVLPVPLCSRPCIAARALERAAASICSRNPLITPFDRPPKARGLGPRHAARSNRSPAFASRRRSRIKPRAYQFSEPARTCGQSDHGEEPTPSVAHCRRKWLKRGRNGRNWISATRPRISNCRRTKATWSPSPLQRKACDPLFLSQGRHLRLHRRGGRLQWATQRVRRRWRGGYRRLAGQRGEPRQVQGQTRLVPRAGGRRTKKAIEAYGVWREKSMYGRKFMGVERTTFLIDPNGRIARIWRKVRVPGHAAER